MKKLSKIIKISIVCLLLLPGVSMTCQAKTEGKTSLNLSYDKGRDETDNTVKIYMSGVRNLKKNYTVKICYKSTVIATGNTGPSKYYKKIDIKKSGSKYVYVLKLPKKSCKYRIWVEAYSKESDDLSSNAIKLTYADSKPEITLGDIKQRVLNGHTYKTWYNFTGTSKKDGGTYYCKENNAQVSVVVRSESKLTQVTCKVGQTIVGTKNNISTGDGGYIAITFNISGEIEGVVSFTATNENGTVARSTGKNVIIDHTKPKIEIENAYRKKQDTVYKNKTVYVTVTIREKNFDSSATNVTVDNIVKSVSWSGSGENKTARIKISNEGWHVIKVTVTDKAGNVADSVKSSNIIIDKTSPVVIVNGVSNGKSYGSKNAKDIVVTIKDNYLADSSSVKLIKSNGEKIKVGVTDSFQDKIYTWHLSDITDDGYYRLEISAKDKAGNKISKKKKSYKIKKGKAIIEFYINRNGSKYDIATESEKYFGSTLKSESMGDIVIYEYNINAITNSTVSLITSLGDVALSQGVNYTCETVTLKEAPKTDKDADYSNYQNVYKYIINKDNFRREGIYGIKIETKANVKNASSNKSLKVTSSNNLNQTINIDNTAPEIILMERKDDTVYIHVRDDNISSKNISLIVSGKTVKLEKDIALPSTSTNYYYTANVGSDSAMELTCTDSAGNKTVTEKVNGVNEERKILLYVIVVAAVVIIAIIFAIIISVRKKKRRYN